MSSLNSLPQDQQLITLTRLFFYSKTNLVNRKGNYLVVALVFNGVNTVFSTVKKNILGFGPCILFCWQLLKNGLVFQILPTSWIFSLTVMFVRPPIPPS